MAFVLVALRPQGHFCAVSDPKPITINLKIMKKYFLFAFVTGLLLSLLFSCNDGRSGEKKPGKLSPEQRVERGAYLVNSIGCDDCHSPKTIGTSGHPEIVPELRLSGYNSRVSLPPIDTATIRNGWSLFSPDFTAAAGVWGISYAANLTSDETGIGNWTEDQFLYAIRNGKFKGQASNRDLLPPMPWFVYKNLTDEDIKSIFAYLKTVPPVENVVPSPKTW